jgi:hypothetical protein
MTINYLMAIGVIVLIAGIAVLLIKNIKVDLTDDILCIIGYMSG